MTIPGLGNRVLQDILLAAGLHPKKKISGMTEQRCREKDFFGRKGRYQTILSKKTVGRPCPYCGSLIQKTNYLGGTVYFCPLCQEL